MGAAKWARVAADSFDVKREDRPLKRKNDWVGAVVRSKRPVSNAIATLPAGTMFFVESTYQGLKMRSAKCARCGISIYITKVPEAHVEYLGHPVNVAIY